MMCVSVCMHLFRWDILSCICVYVVWMNFVKWVPLYFQKWPQFVYNQCKIIHINYLMFIECNFYVPQVWSLPFFQPRPCSSSFPTPPRLIEPPRSIMSSNIHQNLVVCCKRVTKKRDLVAILHAKRIEMNPMWNPCVQAIG